MLPVIFEQMYIQIYYYRRELTSLLKVIKRMKEKIFLS